MFFLTGVAQYLFVPLAEAVVFAMLASYCLVADGRADHGQVSVARPSITTQIERKRNSRNPLRPPAADFEHDFETISPQLPWSAAVCVRSLAQSSRFVSSRSSDRLGCRRCFRWSGAGFLSCPWTRTIQTARARPDRNTHRRNRQPLRPGGTNESAQVIPHSELINIIDNIGLPYSGINTSYSNSAPDRSR